MKRELELWKSALASVLVGVLMLGSPLEAGAQSAAHSNMLEGGTQMILRVSEDFRADNSADSGSIISTVDADVYSADGTRVLIKAGTPAIIEYSAEQNGAWGKAGRICVNSATTKTVDNKRVALRLSSCRNGGSRLGGVIVLSVLFFPIGLVSGCMKGTMPKIQEGTVFNATVMQDVAVE